MYFPPFFDDKEIEKEQDILKESTNNHKQLIENLTKKYSVLEKVIIAIK